MWLVQTRRELVKHNRIWERVVSEQDLSLREHIWDEMTVIRQNVDWLLSLVYIPDAEEGCVITPRSVQKWAKGAEKESINWGDLGVASVQRLGEDSWLVEIEEAAPDCPNLQAYIRKWMGLWGWRVEVRTAW